MCDISEKGGGAIQDLILIRLTLSHELFQAYHVICRKKTTNVLLTNIKYNIKHSYNKILADMKFYLL
jgi:hypothetical protein